MNALEHFALINWSLSLERLESYRFPGISPARTSRTGHRRRYAIQRHGGRRHFKGCSRMSPRVWQNSQQHRDMGHVPTIITRESVFFAFESIVVYLFTTTASDPSYANMVRSGVVLPVKRLIHSRFPGRVNL